MSKLELLQISFLKKDLDCISEDEAVFLFQTGGLILEIISLQKFIHMSSHGTRIRIQRKAENAQAMYFYRLLAGSLYEGWELLIKMHHKYKIIIAKYKPQLDTNAKSSVMKLEKYFSNPHNSCKRIRNNFSHHHNYGEIKKVLHSWPENDKLEIYFSEVHANCRNTASDVITDYAMLGTTDPTDLDKRLDSLFREVKEVATHFVDVFSEYLALILKEIISAKKLNLKEISIGRVPSLDKTRLRYFVENPNL